ncbi:MAG: lspA, partial [Clostridia bacterium]|nr:lspA [Clostridia bacterium]
MYPLLISALIIAVDQFTKSLVIERLMNNADITVIQKFLSFTYVENYGIAFGMFKDQRIFFIIATGLIAAVVLYFMFKTYKQY